MDYLSAYRCRAAAAFRLHVEQHKRSQRSDGNPTTSAKLVVPYYRAMFPQLRAYLDSAASKYRQFKQDEQTQSATLHSDGRSRPSPRSRKLGSCTATLRKNARLHPDIRRDRFLTSLSYARHRKVAIRLDAQSTPCLSTASFPPSSARTCLIPVDVTRAFAMRFKTVAGLSTRPAFRAVFPPPRLTSVSIPPRSLLTAAPIPLRLSGFLPPVPCEEHSALCRLSLASGESVLRSRSRPRFGCGVMDCAEAVRKLYAGKPDEIYRRKTSRQYAVWRRKQRQIQLADSRKLASAEHMMRDSRGVDQLMTHRPADDRSFAPFLFDLESRAYAFSSRISEAPKLRDAMLQKYSTLDVSRHPTDSLKAARLAAEVNPLFHTRVMNRFT